MGNAQQQVDDAKQKQKVMVMGVGGILLLGGLVFLATRGGK
ncbi:hypothetical protein VMA_000310 [Vibrio mimicus VM223]|nr:hypothetical protein VMA_000310 [Vibrio mimicus VM223]